MVIIVICLSMENKLGLKVTMVVLIFRLKICLVRISSKCSYTEPEGVSWKGNMYDFSIDYGSIAADVILDIHKYLIKKMISNKTFWIGKVNIYFSNYPF